LLPAAELSTQLDASKLKSLLTSVEQSLKLPDWTGRGSNACSAECEAEMADTANPAYGTPASRPWWRENESCKELQRLYDDTSDPDAERALLTLAMLRKVLEANYKVHRWSGALTLPVPISQMCYDSDADGEEAPTHVLAHAVGTRAHEVNDALSRAIDDVRRGIVAAGATEPSRGSLLTLTSRLASVTRLNAFRLASTALTVRLHASALKAGARWPPNDDDVDAEPVDVVKFVGVFSLACYFNHRCAGSNVVNVSPTVPGAGFSGARRGDEVAFVATRQISAGDECTVECERRCCVCLTTDLQTRHQVITHRTQLDMSICKRNTVMCVCARVIVKHF
jgi:hypothetical protein